MVTTETCENCGKQIGKLETPRVHGEHVVCVKCWEELSADGLGLPTKVRAQIVQPPPQQQPQIIVMQSPAQASGGRHYHPGVQTIQATGKIWKLQILLSTLLCIAATCFIVGGIQTKNPIVTMIGILSIIAGIGWFVFARLGAWWFHG